MLALMAICVDAALLQRPAIVATPSYSRIGQPVAVAKSPEIEKRLQKEVVECILDAENEQVLAHPSIECFPPGML